MGNTEFIKLCKELVKDYANENIDQTDQHAICEDDVYVVWNAYILGNQKALLSTTLLDGMYYEITYNAAKDEMYFDAYKKWENRKIPIVERSAE